MSNDLPNRSLSRTRHTGQWRHLYVMRCINRGGGFAVNFSGKRRNGKCLCINDAGDSGDDGDDDGDDDINSINNNKHI